MVMQARSPWLGQVRLVSRPALGNHLLPDDWGATKDQPQAYPPQSVFPGREKCTFLGFWSTQEGARTEGVQTKADQASAAGAEIKEIPASWPRAAFSTPGTVVTADMVNGVEVWACPKEVPPQVQPGTMPVQNLPPQEPAAEPAKAAGSTNAKTAWVVGGIAAAGAVAAYFGMK